MHLDSVATKRAVSVALGKLTHCVPKEVLELRDMLKSAESVLHCAREAEYAANAAKCEALKIYTDLQVRLELAEQKYGCQGE
jgi:hypothetical protein